METTHQYTSSIDYINNLSFEYIETYSFQRGIEYEEKREQSMPAYLELRDRKEKQNDLTQVEESLFSELFILYGYTQYLINKSGQFHFSSKKISTFQLYAPAVERLKNILKTEIRDIPRFLCAPTYRDAIVFYSKSNEIISVLNVCLGCQYMETQHFNHINGDFETYDLLKRFFIDIGHEVEEPTKFSYDEIKRLREKYNKKSPK